VRNKRGNNYLKGSREAFVLFSGDAETSEGLVRPREADLGGTGGGAKGSTASQPWDQERRFTKKGKPGGLRSQRENGSCT